MPLKSRLFSGDPSLERCSADDAAHIKPGSRGSHVTKIQIALYRLNEYEVARSETQAAFYGSSTSGGVLAYKSMRGIVNRAYQSRADDIVEKVTIASMDEEMVRLERLPRTDCFPTLLYPSGPAVTYAASPQFAGALLITTSSSPAAVPAITSASLLAQAFAARPTAMDWVAGTLRLLYQIKPLIQRYKAYSNQEILLFAPIQKHFKVNIPQVQDTEASDRVGRLIRLYSAILQALANDANFRADPSDPVKARSPLGGPITIGADFAHQNLNMRAAVLIHEGGHFADATCGHAASEQPAPDGDSLRSDALAVAINPAGKNYAQLDFELAIRNAYSVAQCALHVGLGEDKRPP